MRINDLEMDIPLETEPFRKLAESHGISEDEYILQILKGIESGEIRRFGGIIKHNKAGYNCNTLLAFVVPEDKIDQTGLLLSRVDQISHCYRRASAPKWPYNLYAMLHAKNDKENKHLIEKISAIVEKTAPRSKIKPLKTIKELKKTSFSVPGTKVK